jgi:hypothetical protein
VCCLLSLVISLMCRSFLIWCPPICQFLLLIPGQLEFYLEPTLHSEALSQNKQTNKQTNKKWKKKTY